MAQATQHERKEEQVAIKTPAYLSGKSRYRISVTNKLTAQEAGLVCREAKARGCPTSGVWTYTKFNVPNPVENKLVQAIIAGLGVKGAVHLVEAQTFGPCKTALKDATEVGILPNKPDYFLTLKCKPKHTLIPEMVGRCVADFKAEAKAKLGVDVSEAGVQLLTGFYQANWDGKTKIERCMSRLCTMLTALGLNFTKGLLLDVHNFVEARAMLMRNAEAKGTALPTFAQHEQAFNDWVTAHPHAGAWADVVPSENMLNVDALVLCGIPRATAEILITFQVLDEDKKKADQKERPSVIKADIEKYSKAAAMIGFKGTPCDYGAGACAVTHEVPVLVYGQPQTTFKMAVANQAIAALDRIYKIAAVFDENRMDGEWDDWQCTYVVARARTEAKMPLRIVIQTNVALMKVYAALMPKIIRFLFGSNSFGSTVEVVPDPDCENHEKVLEALVALFGPIPTAPQGPPEE
jgi:hypothetical protein